MQNKQDNPIVLMLSRIVSPFIMLFALYIIFHGHYSPGGGFQGGTMMAAAVLLTRIASGSRISQKQFKTVLTTPLGSTGVLIYWGTGFAALLLGKSFLNYSALTVFGEESMAHSMGILLVEIGVGLAVMALLISIYDDLLEGDPQGGIK